MLYRAKFYITLMFVLITNSVIAEEVRDVYAEPGLNPFQDAITEHQNESIDPFGGTLQLKYTDLVIPGNGGLDIRINRSYVSLQSQSELSSHKTSGIGWNMHFGRVMVNASTFTDAISNICQDSVSNAAASTDNPYIEFPDGGRELLLREPSGSNAYLISQSNWKMECKAGVEGVIVTSPDGIQYTMSKFMFEGGFPTGTYSYLTTEIKDLHGNWLAFQYTDTYGYTLLDKITSSDNRVVNYSYYTPADTNHYLLKSITSNNQTTTYNYEHLAGTSLPYYNLKEVVRPDNTKWQYAYHSHTLTTADPNRNSIKTVTYPTGGQVSYEYTAVVFDPVNTGIKTTAVAKKTVRDLRNPAKSWTFQYEPSTTVGNDVDITTVTAPNGKTVYEYYGYAATVITGTDPKLIGLQKKKDIYDRFNRLIQTEQTSYELYLLSNENYFVRNKLFITTNIPRIKQKIITRDGTNYVTDYNNYDTYGNAHQIVETSNNATKTTNYTYYIDESKWILNQIEDEQIVGTGIINRTFNVDGTLKSESIYGVKKDYTYHTTGDLASVTDPLGRFYRYSTKYNNYYRGVAQEELHPTSMLNYQIINITKSRTVNPTGTVASETNGRGFTTNYQYDRLNRVSSIIYPKAGSKSVNISYSSRSKTITRGNFKQVSLFDGFGRITKTTKEDLLKSTAISNNQKYDALGQVTFKSNPNSVIGTNFVYDTLGRQTKITHPDNSFQIFNYLANNKTKVTNERTLDTIYGFRSFGNPDERELIRSESPENILTIIDRNIWGGVVRVWQGANGGAGHEKTIEYDSYHRARVITTPEKGRVEYSYDSRGNLSSISAPKPNSYYGYEPFFYYDYQNRLVEKYFFDDSYNESYKNVQYQYDENNNVTNMIRGGGTKGLSKTLSYDENDNLTQEDISYLASTNFQLKYDYSNLDHLNSIVYPSGRTVNYAPDALGRPTQATPYLSSVSYHPSGQVSSMTAANGQITDYTFNDRLWKDSIKTDGITDAIDLSYSYDSTGNIKNIFDLIGNQFDRDFTYDGADRLKTASGIWGDGAITYDEIGNIKTKVIGTHSLVYNYDSASNHLKSVAGSKNSNYSYGALGNISHINNHQYVYDDAGNLDKTYDFPHTTYVPIKRYRYDANDRLAAEYNYIGSKIDKLEFSIYSQHDNLMGEYKKSGLYQKEYVYLGSQLIAEAKRTPVPAPSIPSGFTGPANSAGSYELSWQASTGSVDRYEINFSITNTYSSSSAVYSTTALSKVFTSRFERAYYHRIRACSIDLCSDYVNLPQPVVVKLIPPVANAGEDLIVNANDLVQLDGSASSSNDGSSLKYYWSEVVGPFSVGSGATLLNNYTANASFIAPIVEVDTTFTFRLQVKDYLRATNTDDVNITIRASIPDKIAPIVIPPEPITTEATAQLTTVAFGTAAANDDEDGVLIATADNSGPFAVGIHTITWSATDAAGNVGSAIQTVTVTDTTTPIVTVSASQTLEATGELTAVTLGAATATDLVDGAITPIPSLTSPFTVGTHIVIWTATDVAGNMGSAAQLITVTDTTAPVLTVPAAVTIEATASVTPVNLGIATANDLVDGALVPAADNTGPYSVGTHTVKWSVSDAAGNISTATQVVTITDTTAPIITIPANVTAEATGPLTLVSFGAVTANDLVDGVLAPVANNNGPFAIGIHTITWSVTDAAGNASSATQTLTVTDTTAPTVTPPAAITLEATAALTPVVLGVATASDLVDGTLIPAADITGRFAVGTHVITWRATDANGNTGIAIQTVIVQDTTAPKVTAPANIAIEANSVLTTIDLGIAAANDIVDGAITPVADNLGPYSTGVHTINWSATDVAGNVATAIQTVTVNDTTAPELTIPADITLESAVPLAIDISTASATDIFTPISISNNAPAEFPLGITTVTWTATDIHGNSNQGAQYVTVTEPAKRTRISMTANLDSPQYVGSVVEISALLKGADANYEFEFNVLTSGSRKWKTIQSYSRSPYLTWDTTGYQGRNVFRVKARPIGSNAKPIRKNLSFRVKALPRVKRVTLTSDLASPQAIGSLITLTGGASGGSGDYEYKFKLTGAKSGRVTLQDWSNSDTVTWNTQGYSGKYKIQVLARNAGSTDRPVTRKLRYRLK